MSTGGIWALILGCIFAVVHYIRSPLITSGEFGFLQWVIGFVDVIVFPSLIALVICLIFTFLKMFSATINAANFMLLWCVPFGVFQMMSHSTQAGVLYLVIVPLIWISLAVGLRFFIYMIPLVKRWIAVFCVIATVLLPFIAATAYWALFCHNDIWGYTLLAIMMLPALIHTGTLFVKSLKNES